MYMIGCDVAKATLDAAWLDENAGHWHDKNKIPNQRGGFAKLLSWMRKTCDCAPEELCLVIEATGVYHVHLANYAYDAGVQVIVTNPGRAADHASSQNRLNKTDRLDARGLQHYGRQLEKRHEYVPHSQEIQALQAMLSRLRQLDQDWIRENNRLEKCPFIPQSQLQTASIKRQLRHIRQEKTRLQDAVDKLIAEQPQLSHIQRLLVSIKGIGKLTSQWLLPLLYRGQFESARQLAAYLGLTPVHKSSGTSLNRRGRLSGRGNRDMRSRLYMPAVCASTHDPAMAGFYDSLIRRGKTPKQALTAVMRKLVHICYGVVKNDQEYQCPVPT